MSRHEEVVSKADWSNEWPLSDLEEVAKCPACGSSDRAVRFRELQDKVFFTEGRWTLYDCHDCTASYLDPRPNEASIGRTYARYYTHQSRDSEPGKTYFWQKASWRTRLKSSYLNARYGYDFPNVTPFGHVLIKAFPRVVGGIDFEIRHLPAPLSDADRLLDVGSGNGDFVALARALGYRAMGLDPDPVAVAQGRKRDLDVRQGILPDPGFTDGGFA